MQSLKFGRRIFIVSLIVFSAIASRISANAQVRGVYPLGMSATNSGVTPESGFSYSNILLIYSRNRRTDAEGKTIATGLHTVVMDMNSFIWVSKKEILGGARFSVSATLPIAKNSLDADEVGPLSGGSGLADSYYQPFILGWDTKRAAIRAVYGFLAPTGRFNSTANDNVGSGYWTHAFSSGQTFFLTEDKATTLSAFQMYEVHTRQETTHDQPGQTFNLDYSLMHSIVRNPALSFHVGLVGYGQWQTTGKRGPAVTPDDAKSRYKVAALGFAANLGLPSRRVTLGFKYFKEVWSRSTFQGYSVQASGSIKL
jgi:hypothetical protein